MEKKILLKTGQQCRKSTDTGPYLPYDSFAIVFNKSDKGIPILYVDGHRLGFVKSLDLSIDAKDDHPSLNIDVIEFCFPKDVKERLEKIEDIVPGAKVRIRKAK